jgi:Zn-dependent protease with chaperone function
MNTALRTSFAAFYYAGLTPEREAVTVVVSPGGLRVDRADGSSLWWPYDELRLAPGFQRGEPVRLERGQPTGEAIVVADPGVLTAVGDVAPNVAHRFPDAARRRGRLWRVVALATAALAMGVTAYLWGIPRLADRVAARVPVPWEEQLGRAVAGELAAGARDCADPALTAAVTHIVTRLAAAAPESPYTFRVRVVDSDVFNAFAAPGGFIVVNRGLLARTGRPEELAGVLAHEMQHVLLRHGTKAVLREIPTSLLLSGATGDWGGLGRGVQALGTLGGLRYQRSDEAAADREGTRLLARAGVDPEGMIAFFGTLGREAGDLPSGLEYFSTHPRTARRIADLRQLRATVASRSEPLLPGTRWTAIAHGCVGNPKQ